MIKRNKKIHINFEGYDIKYYITNPNYTTKSCMNAKFKLDNNSKWYKKWSDVYTEECGIPKEVYKTSDIRSQLLSIIRLYENDCRSSLFIEQVKFQYGDSYEPLKIITMDMSGLKLKDIDGIEIFSNLERLKLNDNNLTNLKGIEKLKKLEVLYCNNNNINTLVGIEELPNITDIHFNGNDLPLDFPINVGYSVNNKIRQSKYQLMIDYIVNKKRLGKLNKIK